MKRLLLLWLALCTAAVANPPIPGLSIPSIHFLGNPQVGTDLIAPTLTNPAGAATGTTTASGAVDTDEGNGTVYTVASTSATEPTRAQVKAGQTHTGAAAADSDSAPVINVGTQSLAFTGLATSTTYYPHYMHEDAVGNQSDVVTAVGFTTNASGAWTGLPRTGSPLRTDSAASDSTSFTPALAPHDTGDTLLIVIGADGNPVITCTGWTQVDTTLNNASNSSVRTFRRNTVAAGSSESNPTCSSDAAQQYEAEAYSIPGAGLLNVGRSTGLTTSTANPNPDTVTPGGGVNDFLSIPFLVFDNNSFFSVTGFPSGYTGTDTGFNGSSGGVGIAVAHKHVTAATSDNPGTFTLNGATEQLVYGTLAVWP